MYEIAICDDLPVDRRILIEDILKYGKYQNQIRFHEYSSGNELLNAMGEVRFGVIFLDVKMEGIDGEKTAKEIRKIDDSVVLVFYTGYAEPSAQSFEVQPYRFIKKNMSENDRMRSIAASLDKMAELANSPILEAKWEGNRLFLRPDDIIYIEKYRKNVRVYLSEAAKQKYEICSFDNCEPEIRISSKLENIYEVLKKYGFGYPHDSYIINYKYLLSCNKTGIRLYGCPNTFFKISRSKSVEFNRLKREFLTGKYGEW